MTDKNIAKRTTPKKHGALHREDTDHVESQDIPKSEEKRSSEEE